MARAEPRLRSAGTLTVALLLSGCGTSSAPTGALASASAEASASGSAALEASPAIATGIVTTPPGVAFDPTRPLVVFLHGLGGSGEGFASSLSSTALSQKFGFSFVAPDGDFDSEGRRFWAASKACCDFDGRTPDHVALIDELVRSANVTGGRSCAQFSDVIVVGLSNGGFMGHRLGCERTRVTAIVSIAGSGPGELDPPCEPGRDVSVIQIHGDADAVVPYEGGAVLGVETRPKVPSARATVDAWAKRNGCKGKLALLERADLASDLPGEETRIEAFSGCRAKVELWTIEGGSHLAGARPRFVERALGRLLPDRSVP